MQGINKNYNRTGKIVATAFILLIVLMSFMIKIDPPMIIPEEPEDEIVAILDFTPPVNAGGASSGGSETFKEEPEEDAAPEKETTETDPIPEENTQVEESPVVTKPSNNSSAADGEGSSQTPANDFGNLFGGSGGGDNGGDGSGSDGTGVGAGDGPGIGNGVGDGESRIPVKNPVVKNPVQDQGRVMLELIIDREGKVLSVKVLKSHSLTTTTNESHFKTAEKAAWDWEFNKDPQGAAKQKLYKSINFTLD